MKHTILSFLASLAFAFGTLIRTVKDVMPGYGSAGIYQSQQNVAAPVATTAITTTAFTGTVSAGLIRVKTASTGAGGTNKVGTITVTDGVTTTQIYAGDAVATPANQGLDEIFEFRSDLNITAITVNYTVAVAAGTVDVEWALVH
jgi:hypothetical protein